MFIVPTNKDTMTLDYNIRMIITDNPLHPKVYEVTKIMDTLPLGCEKVVLKQVHYNPHTDLCGKDKDHIYFDDNKIHMVADFYKSKINPNNLTFEHELYINGDSKEMLIPNEDPVWTLSEVNEFLYVNGQPQSITATSINGEGVCKWFIYIDNESYTDANKIEELEKYLDMSVDGNTFIIRAINKDLANYIVKVGVGTENSSHYDDFVEMEVRI